ncbi:MAG TPA: hypothetical protein ENN67_04375, partial [Firmicutes bacterium]|nr:hypothetical protein [Bacillota bacterium]
MIPVFSVPVFANTEDEETVIARILQPETGSAVYPLDSLILIQVNPSFTGEKHYYLIQLDGEPIRARWDPDALTFSYYPERMLSPGEHSIKVFLTVPDVVENRLVAESDFTVIGPKQTIPERREEERTQLFDLGTQTETLQPPQPSRPSSTVTGTGDYFRLSGRTSVNAAFVTLEGIGSDQRQE